jgi:hypothetical protein
MESKNRNTWIIVVVALLAACCCALLVAAVAGSWLYSRFARFDPEPFDLGGLYRERTERTFQVGDAPVLDIDNFAGAVTIRPGEGPVVRVVATSKASSRSGLERITVSITQEGDRVVIKTRKSVSTGNASVDLEITAPASSRVDLNTGAGSVDMRDIGGPIDAHSGAGTIEVRGAQGVARLNLGAGQIVYEGSPSGDCRFQTGAGEIILTVPADLNAQVDLSTGIGSVGVDLPVRGRVSIRSVEGTIGDGSQGSIQAHTGAGSVVMKGR